MSDTFTAHYKDDMPTPTWLWSQKAAKTPAEYQFLTKSSEMLQRRGLLDKLPLHCKLRGNSEQRMMFTEMKTQQM